MKFKKIINKLIIIFFLVLFLSPLNVVQAVPDHSQDPTLAWTQIENPSSGVDVPYASAINSNALYIAGSDAATTNNQWRIEKRDLTTGELINGFGTGGVIQENPSPGSSAVYSMALNNDAIYVAGVDAVSGVYRWKIEKRDLTTGLLINGFGTGGVVVEDPSISVDQIQMLAINDNGLYIVGSDSITGNLEWRIEKRDLTTGDLIPNFGVGGGDGDGIITEDISVGNDNASRAIIANNALYITGSDAATTNNQWRIEKRDLTTGELINGFGTGGVIQENPSSGSDKLVWFVNDVTGLYVAGYDVAPTNNQWRIEKRDLTTGELINGFGTGGVIQENPSSGSDMINSMAMDSSGLYLVGVDATPGNMQWRLQKYAFPEDTTVPTFSNLPGTTSPINITEGQTITTNPYIIEVKPTDNIGIQKVNFYVNNILICVDTTADSDGVYSCSWDTSPSLYRSDIKVIAYDTTGNQSIALERSVIVDPSLYTSLTPPVLPETGSNHANFLTNLINLFARLY